MRDSCEQQRSNTTSTTHLRFDFRTLNYFGDTRCWARPSDEIDACDTGRAGEKPSNALRTDRSTRPTPRTAHMYIPEPADAVRKAQVPPHVAAMSISTIF